MSSMILGLPTLAIILLLSIQTLRSAKGADDETQKEVLLEQVERWIRYSICDSKRQSGTYHKGNEEDYIPPRKSCDGFPLFDGFVRGTCFTSTKIVRDFFKRDWPRDMVQFPQWDGVQLDLNGFAYKIRWATKPNWLKSLTKISDRIGWRHFELFKAPTEEWKDLTPLPTNGGINIGKIAQMLKRLNPQGIFIDDEHSSTNLFGRLTAKYLLHMVLYRTLQRAIDIVPMEHFGDMNRIRMSKRDYAAYQLIQEYHERKLECREGMPRQDYVLYWLRQMYKSLKQNYAENRAKFLEYTGQDYIIEVRKSKQTQNLFSEWAKYVTYWNKVLDTVERYGIQELDPTINLFGPSKGEESDKKKNDEAHRAQHAPSTSTGSAFQKIVKMFIFGGHKANAEE